MKEIDPTKHQFCYCLSKYDCYELKHGTCSLYLSKDEVNKIIEKEGENSNENSVTYCRDLAKSLLKNNYYQQQQKFSIKMHPRDCGHYVFTDGQHRTCIAKHLSIGSMYVTLENFQTDPESKLNCRGCYEKEAFWIKIKCFLNKILMRLNIKYRLTPPSDFIDEDYMRFREHT